MNQLQIIQKKSIKKNKKAEQSVEELEYENKREGHGLNIALTRKVYRLTNSDTFYCESEKVKDLYYFVKYESSFQWCSCLDNSMRHIKCKHIFGLEFAIMKGTLQDVEKLPSFVKRDNTVPES